MIAIHTIATYSSNKFYVTAFQKQAGTESSWYVNYNFSYTEHELVFNNLFLLKNRGKQIW